MLIIQITSQTISAQKFRETIREKSKLPLSDFQIDKAWNSMILDFPEDRIKLLGKLKPHYRLFLLSNTNEIHRQYSDAKIREIEGIGLSEYFDKAYYSHIIGMKKPDLEIYEYVLKDAGIKAHETLFLDDKKENLDAAMSLGINTMLVTKTAGPVELLTDFIPC